MSKTKELDKALTVLVSQAFRVFYTQVYKNELPGLPRFEAAILATARGLGRANVEAIVRQCRAGEAK